MTGPKDRAAVVAMSLATIIARAVRDPACSNKSQQRCETNLKTFGARR